MQGEIVETLPNATVRANNPFGSPIGVLARTGALGRIVPVVVCR